MKCIFVFLALAIIISCGQRRPSVVIKQGDPQQFIVSANGLLDVFSVRGPVTKCKADWSQARASRMETYWEIAPLHDFDVSQLKESGPIIYGRVPDGFRQVTPVNGFPPPPICPGGPYGLQLAVRDSGGVNMLFSVYENGRIVTEADAD